MTIGHEMQTAFASPLAAAAALRGSAHAPNAVTTRRPRHTASVARVAPRCSAAPPRPKANPNDVLSSEELAEWKTVSDRVRSLAPDALASDACDRIVAKAFGWGPTSQKFWRGDVVEEPPTMTRVSAALKYLTDELGFSDEEIAAIVKKFPEALRLDVDARMRENVSYLDKQWNLSGPRLLDAIKDQPAILGYDVDCGGDCMSECARCWVRF